MFRAKGYILERNVGFIPVAQCRSPTIKKMLAKGAVVTEVLSYVDTLPPQEEKNGAKFKGRVVIWEGTCQIPFFNTRHTSQKCPSALPDECKIRLMSGADRDALDGSPWMAGQGRKDDRKPTIYPVPLYEVRAAFLRESCASCVLVDVEGQLAKIVNVVPPMYSRYASLEA
jgi:hypothetical protein